MSVHFQSALYPGSLLKLPLFVETKFIIIKLEKSVLKQKLIERTMVLQNCMCVKDCFRHCLATVA